jgi:hypothetical protein
MCLLSVVLLEHLHSQEASMLLPLVLRHASMGIIQRMHTTPLYTLPRDSQVSAVCVDVMTLHQSSHLWSISCCPLDQAIILRDRYARRLTHVHAFMLKSRRSLRGRLLLPLLRRRLAAAAVSAPRRRGVTGLSVARGRARSSFKLVNAIPAKTVLVLLVAVKFPLSLVCLHFRVELNQHR